MRVRAGAAASVRVRVRARARVRIGVLQQQVVRLRDVHVLIRVKG